MNPVEKAIQKLAGEINPKIVFVAVSSGVDSTLLLDLLSTYFNVVALHVNYKLRGEESDQDQAFLEEFCAKKNIPFLVKEHDLKTELSLKVKNLQNRAREIRYEFFRENLENNTDSFLFLGHHADDQIETFFIHYFRNSGIAGLSGMKLNNGLIYRPFLPFSKQELLECAKEKNLFWREDQSNSKNIYLRNRFRNEIIPALTEQVPELKSSILKLMSILQENQALIQQEISVYIRELTKKKSVLISELIDFGDERWIELLRQANVPTGFLIEIKKLLHSKKGARLIFPKNAMIHAVIREKEELFFEFDKEVTSAKPNLKISIVTELPTSYNKQDLYLDDSKIDGELTLRKWSRGDRIFPLGITGSKLISDVLTDAKVPHAQRYNQWVLCDGSKLISCIGFCIDRRAIATAETKKIRCVQIEQS